MGETINDHAWRARNWQDPFSKAEMDAMRHALRDEEGVLAEVLAMARRLARHLPFAVDALAAYHCVRDPATPARVKLILLGALAYFVMPFDAIPDVVPLVGFTDDAAVLATAIAAVRGSILPGHVEKAKETLREQRR